MGETLQSKMRRLTPYVRGAIRSVEVGGRHYVLLTLTSIDDSNFEPGEGSELG
jgi:hypothetical protein